MKIRLVSGMEVVLGVAVWYLYVQLAPGNQPLLALYVGYYLGQSATRLFK